MEKGFETKKDLYLKKVFNLETINILSSHCVELSVMIGHTPQAKKQGQKFKTGKKTRKIFATFYFSPQVLKCFI